ncbi:DEP domain-containing protein 7 [Octopus bimaculoides]|nr:DEP domain-containing protein 7 [Octopus bimaculoides]|eukprot:XP_014788606.1 PREDICTED: DEP domain-containing protein 7-like [Octopus bimaculoides]
MQQQPIYPKLTRFERGLPLRESRTYAPFRATQIWNSIVAYLKENVEVKRRRHIMKYYNSCFTGCSAVDTVYAYLTTDKEVFSGNISRDKAVKVCQTILDKKIFEAVSVFVRNSYTNSSKKPIFEDSNSKLYRFVQNTSSPTTTSQQNDSISSIEGIELEENNKSMETDPISRRISLDPSLIFHSRNTDEPTTPQPLMRVRSTGSIQLFQSTPITKKQESTLSVGLKDDVLRQVSLCELLRLLDIHILDGFLAHLHMEDGSRQNGWTNYGLSYATCASPMFGKRSHDPFLTAAMDCLATSTQDLPGLRKEGFCVPLSLEEKQHLFETVVNHYKNLDEPLLSSWDLDFHLSIRNMILNGFEEKAKHAFHLYSLILPRFQKEKLIRILNFIQIVTHDEELQQCSQMYSTHPVIRVFTDSILRHPLMAHELAVIVVSFFLDNYGLLSDPPPKYIQDNVNHILSEIEAGKHVPYQPPRFSRPVSVVEYEQVGQECTNSSLVLMMNSIIDNVQLSLKEKKSKLKHFQKHHPELYKKHFANMV